MKLSECIDKFIKHEIVIGSTINTLQHYKTHLSIFQKFIKEDIEINNINYETYEDYIVYLRTKKTKSNKNLSSVTIKSYARDLKTFLKFCYDEKYLIEPLYLKIQLPKCNKPTIKILSKDDMNKLFYFDCESVLGSRNHLIIALMLDAGLRRSEICELETSDFDFKNKVIRVQGKGQKERLVPLTDTIKMCYDNYFILFPHSGYAILNNKYQKMTGIAIEQIIKRVKNRLGLKKLSPHYLRHNFATWFLINGGDALSLQTILGHTTLQMTENYTHIANQYRIAKNSTFSPLSNLEL